MEFFEAGHKIKYFGVRRVTPAVVMFGRADDDVHHIGETTAATAAFFHRVIDFCRHDQLPTVLVEKRDDGVFDLFYGYEVAAANQHVVLPVIRNVLNWFHKAKEDICCQQKTAFALIDKDWNRSKLDQIYRIFLTIACGIKPQNF